MKTSILMLVIACLIAPSLQAQSKRELKKQKAAEEIAKARSLVESGSFRFDAIRAFPSRGMTVDLFSHTAFVEILKDEAQADLPFFGTAQGVAYSPESGGIQFDGVMEEFNLNVNEKKNRINLSFAVKTGRDRYICNFTITGESSVSLGVTSNLRSQISYDGSISAIKKEN
jgi:hypothetical protein